MADAPAAGQTGGSSNTGGGSPSSSGSSSSSSSSTTLNMGMGPQSSSRPAASNNGASSRLSPEQLFTEYGPEIFAHDRFKELTGYKQQWDAVAPIAQEYGGAEGLSRLHQHLGPVWQTIEKMAPEQASAVWGKLYPVLNAIISGQPIDPFFAKQVAAAAVAEGGLDPEDPLVKELTNVKTEFQTFRQQSEQDNRQKQAQKVREIATTNFTNYEKLFAKLAEEHKIPLSAHAFLGDIQTNRIIRHMPKNPQTGQVLNPLYSYNEEAFKTCFEKEVLAAWKTMSQAGVENAVVRLDQGGAQIPNTQGQGGTPSGVATPPDRKAKALRMAQWFNRGK